MSSPEGDIINMDTFLGNIALFPYNFAPMGWHLCDGTLLQISQNTALFSLIGTQFGGDGQTTFGLPDLRPIFVDTPGLGLYMALQGIYPTRS
jgi:microcystin-dependent protein